MGFIEFKNVTYTYPLGKKPALKNITCIFEKGKILWDHWRKCRWKNNIM